MSVLKVLLRQSLVRIGAVMSGDVRPEQEAVYQAIFDRDLMMLSIPNRFYPLNSAANYSLLYLLLRSAQELDIQSLVELGAGQTSILIESLSQKGLLKGQKLTIEHDDGWAERIGSAVTHSVVSVPLAGRNDAPRLYEGYDLSSIAVPAKIDFLIIDGPPAFGSRRTFARLGALPLLEFLDRDGYAIIIDDAEREGERLLVERVHAFLSKRGDQFRKVEIRGIKKQAIFASGRMQAAAFY